MPTKPKVKKNNKDDFMPWAAAGFAIGFACGYITLESAVSGIILGIGLGITMGLASKSFPKNNK